MSKKSIWGLLLFMVIIFLNIADAKKLKVVTTLPSLLSITKSIGGEFVEVSSITKGAQDAHFVEAKPSYMVQLNRADLLIYSGLELEIGWLPLLIQGARNSQITAGSIGNLNASIALPSEHILEKPRGEIDRSMGDVHAAGNPHYLLNPANAILVAQLIADKLTELDGDHKNDYQHNLNTFITTLQEKITEFEQRFTIIKGKEVVCYHPHWSYLLDWMDLKLAGYIELRPGIPPTPKHKRETIELIKTKNIKVIIISSWKEPTIAKEVANIGNAQLLILPGETQALAGTDDYLSWIQYMVEQIVTAFTKI